MSVDQFNEDLRQAILKMTTAIDRNSERIHALCVVLVAKGVCTADELAQVIEKVKQQ